MKRFGAHAKSYILRGFLTCFPLVLSYFAVKFIYIFIDRRVIDLVDKLIGFRIPGLGLLFVLIFLYLIGFLASNIIGRRILGLLESISKRIPIVKTTYQVGKQLSSTLSLPEKQIFKRVVFIDFFNTKSGIIGFVTGTVTDKRTNEKLLKVFIPSVPNPTTGFMCVLKESQTVDPGWTIEQGIKTVISGGIIGPDELGSASSEISQ